MYKIGPFQKWIFYIVTIRRKIEGEIYRVFNGWIRAEIHVHRWMAHVGTHPVIARISWAYFRTGLPWVLYIFRKLREKYINI